MKDSKNTRRNTALALFAATAGLLLAACGTATPTGTLTVTAPAPAPFNSATSSSTGVLAPPSETLVEDAVVLDGTPEHPYTLGTAATVGDWTVTVVAVKKNATSQVLKANTFNSKPANGFEYAFVTIKATYHGDAKGDAGMDLSFSFLGNDATIYTDHNTMVVARKDLSSAKSVVTGGQVTGGTVILVPISVINAGGLLQVEESLSFDGTPVNWKV